MLILQRSTRASSTDRRRIMLATRRLVLAALLAAALVGIAVADDPADSVSIGPGDNTPAVANAAGNNNKKPHDTTPQAATSSSPASTSADIASAAPTEKVQLEGRALLSCMRAGRAVPSPCALYLVDASAVCFAVESGRARLTVSPLQRMTPKAVDEAEGNEDERKGCRATIL